MQFTFVLQVLPPWGPLYHWQTRSLGEQSKIPWKRFFDVESISRYVPALDFEDYLKRKFSIKGVFISSQIKIRITFIKGKIKGSTILCILIFHIHIDSKNNNIIDMVYYLQNYPGGWENGEFIEKLDIQECNRPPPYRKDTEESLFYGQFWRFENVRAKEMECISIQGEQFNLDYGFFFNFLDFRSKSLKFRKSLLQ